MMRKRLWRSTAPGWDQRAARRWAGGAAVAGALGLAACSDVSPADQERLGEAPSAVLGGTLDQGRAPKFPAVVGVQLWLPTPPGEQAVFAVATGVALSDRVVVTAGHLVPDMLRGCAPYTYNATAVPAGPARLRVLTATGSDTDSGDVLQGDAYNVDAIAGLRRLFPLNAYDCGADPALGCAPDVKENFVPPFDVALLHLNRPLAGVEPMKFVARIGPTNATEATYPIDPSTWPGAVIATVVGVGNSNPMPAPSPPILGPRRYGPTAVTALGWQGVGVLTPDQCDLQTESFSCDRCMIEISPSRSVLLPMGGAARQAGDSGAPLLVNATALGATPIAGLPAGEPFVVGFGSNGWPDGEQIHDLSAASWDATASPDGPTEMGTLLLRHLRRGLFAGSAVDFGRAPPARPGGIPPRKGFIAVFSRSEDRAFVLGGHDASTGETLHDLWMRPVEGPGAWSQFELDGFEVGSVLAATWSYLDHRLWMIDEVPVDSEGDMEARLYRVEPYLGAVQLVGAWRHQPDRDRVSLVLDRDGAVLLVTSSTTRAAHSVVRFEATPYAARKPLRVSLRHWPGALAGAPFADAAGYSFVLRGPEGALQLERQTDLGLLSGDLSDVGSVL